MLPPKPLAIPTLSVFPFPHHLLLNSYHRLIKFSSPKPNFFVICKSGGHSRARQDTKPQIPYYPDPKPEPDGSGAAAPTRGEIFLESHQSSMAASTVLLSATKKKKKIKDKATKVLKVSPVLPSCYGCGAPLQTSETDAPGYVEPDTYELV